MVLLIVTPIVLVSAIMLLALDTPPIRFVAIMLTVLGVALVLSGCVTRDPSSWRSYEHAEMAKACRVTCHPGSVSKYDSLTGTCECGPKE